MKDSQNTSELSEESKLQALRVWKKVYLKLLVDALAPHEAVLQVGFDQDAANQIQGYKPVSHTVIERDPSKVQQALKWAEGGQGRKVVAEGWDLALPALGKFNSILYSDYSNADDSQTINYLFTEQILSEISKAKGYLKELEDSMAQVSAKYSDEDLENFYLQKGQFNKDKLGLFFLSLRDNKNITQDQYARAVKKYGLENFQQQKLTFIVDHCVDMLLCLEQCLAKHMEVGAKFVGFSNNIISKYEDPFFFERIITNPSIDFKEKLIPVDIEGKKFEALVMSVEKRK